MEIDEYPSVEQAVEFAVRMTRHRERACLAQRADAGPKLRRAKRERLSFL